MTGSFDPRTPAGVAHIARLSRLALSAEERDAMADHMARVLDSVAALDALDTEGVPAAAHERAVERLRPDAVTPSLDPADALANAPRSLEGGFGVPAVLGDGS